MHVVVTGGSGFIGSALVRRLVNDGHRVSVICRRPPSPAAGLAGAETVLCDLTDKDTVTGLRIKAADCLFHLAGPSSGMEANAEPERAMSDIQAAAENALALARRLDVGRVLNASTAGVYGNAGDGPIPERAPCRPLSPYGHGKLAAEARIAEVCIAQGIDFAQLRYFTVYGPGQDLGRATHGLVGIFLAMLMKGPKVTSRGSLERVRDIIHIDDAVEACVRRATTGDAGALNIGSGRGITIGGIINALAAELGLLECLEIEVAAAVPNDPASIVADTARLRSTLGFTPVNAPEDGLRAYAAWATAEAASVPRA